METIKKKMYDNQSSKMFRNTEVLRDLARLFPSDELTNAYDRWKFWIDSTDRLHLTTTTSPDILDVEFAGDGVCTLTIYDSFTHEAITSKVFDDHGDSTPEKFQKILKSMTPYMASYKTPRDPQV